MARIKIDYSELEEAANNAVRAANEMDVYAQRIGNVVESPINNLTGGSSQYTSTVASLAQRKASELRSKRDKYKSFETGARNLADSARAADGNVESYINSLKAEDSKNLTWGQKICAAFYDLYSNFISGSDVGKVLNVIVGGVELVNELKVVAFKKAYNWFVYGKGRYVLNIVLTVAAAVGAIVALCNPVTGPFAALFIAAAAIAAVVKVATAGVTLSDNLKALFMDSDDPGAARYYGNTSSLSDFAKKHIHDKRAQSFAKATDIVGKVADAVSSFGSLFTKTHTMAMTNPDGSISVVDVKQLDWSSSTLKENLLKKVGVTSSVKLDDYGRPIKNIATNQDVMNYKFSMSSLVKNAFGIKDTKYGDIPSVHNGAPVYSGLGRADDAIKTVKNGGVLPSELGKLKQLSIYGGGGSKEVFKYGLKHTPIVKDFADFGYLFVK